VTLPTMFTASRVFALVGLTLAVVGGLGGLVVRIMWPVPILPTTFGVGPSNLVAIAILGITWTTVGALLVVRRPDNPVGRIMVVVGVGLALSILTVAVAFAALAEGTVVGREVASLAGGLTGLLTPILVLVFYLPFIFPTGHGHTPRWEVIGRVFLWSAMVLGALLVLQPGDVHLLPGIRNPIGFGPDLRPIFGDRVVGAVEGTALAILSPIWVLAVVSRYRAAGGIERQQLKWFLAGSSLTVVAGAVMFAVAAVTRGPIGEAPLMVFALAGTTVPAAIGIAILRYHLYDIDRIISRTIAYAIVSAITAIVFGGGIVLLTTVLARLAEGQAIAVAAATLTAFVAFQPLLRRVRRNVDRRFDRVRYDAEQTVAGFSTRLRDQVDIATVTTDLRATVQGAVNPSSVGLWIREARP
jgi:hypothetical protein